MAESIHGGAFDGGRLPGMPVKRVLARFHGIFGLAIVALAAAAYSNSFTGPLVLDDLPSIRDNATIRHWGTALATPVESTTHGRPVLNLSFALNYALGGESVTGYHALNLAIHVLAGLVLFGILRRTFLRIAAPAAASLAFFVSSIWILHPLNTSAVTYVVQRAESLMGLFYLLTLYFFIRYAEESDRPRPSGSSGGGVYAWLSVSACVLGMATKEVMVSAPVVVLLYDRTFISGSFRDSLRRHRATLVGLAATWWVLFGLVVSTHGRGGTAGFGSGVSVWHYTLTQAHAIAHYLRLVVFPHPLIFYYGRGLISDPLEVVPQALLVAGLLGLTVWALKKAPAVGFAAASFFLILAPSSSFVPVATETLAEHRMYLAIIPVVALGAVGLYRILESRSFPVLAVIGLSLGVATYARNGVYRTSLGLWQDTASHDPLNPWAHNNLGCEWNAMPGRSGEAMAEFNEALRLKPDHAEAHYNLAEILGTLPGRSGEAIAHYEAAIRSNPAFAQAHNNLGGLLTTLPGRWGDAVSHLREALRLKPDYAMAHYNLGNAWSMVPDQAGNALREYREALREDPRFDAAHNNLGKLLASRDDTREEAVAHFQEAIRIRPGNAEAHYNLASVWSDMPGKSEDALNQFQEALRLKPEYPEALVNLGNLYAVTPGRMADAIANYRKALSLSPDDPEGNFNLAVALLKGPGHEEEALAHLRAFLKRFPDNERALRMLSDHSLGR